MEIYTLDSGFRRTELVEEFTSAIWTERYSKHGDVTLVVPPTPEMMAKFAKGSMPALEGSDEVMLLDTHLIEDGSLKITGTTLDKFLDERIYREVWNSVQKVQNFNHPPGHLMNLLVQVMVTEEDNFMHLGIDRGLQKIPNLSMGTKDTTIPAVPYQVSFGPLYSICEQIAEAFALGFSLYLEWATDAGYSLKFKNYRGVDRSAEVQFSPVLDSLTDIKELQSITGYKTAAYTFAPDNSIYEAGFGTITGKAFVPGTENLVGFGRRVLMVLYDDITRDSINDDVNTLRNLLNQRAKDALANNNFTKVVDGEVVPQEGLEYGTHYGLGDIVGLQGHSGDVQKARITEYIRTHDNTGDREYPTVPIIE